MDHLKEPQTSKCLMKSGIGAERLHRRHSCPDFFKGQEMSKMS